MSKIIYLSTPTSNNLLESYINSERDWVIDCGNIFVYKDVLILLDESCIDYVKKANLEVHLFQRPFIMMQLQQNLPHGASIRDALLNFTKDLHD